MALLDASIGYTVTPPLAAPTVTEKVKAPGPGTYLWVKVGATATTITLVTPGLVFNGLAVPDTVIGPLTNAEALVKVDGGYRDANNEATVTFSQVATVTATVLRG